MSIITPQINDYARRSVLCWLASTNKDGLPNVSPKEIFCTYNDDTLLIANIASPSSALNIQANPKVCVSFVDVFDQRGFKLTGDAQLVKKADAEFAALHAPLYEMAGNAYPIINIFKISVTDAAPVNAPSYHLFPDRSDEMRRAGAYVAYGVKPA